jgi:hypothetical protein
VDEEYDRVHQRFDLNPFAIPVELDVARLRAPAIDVNSPRTTYESTLLSAATFLLSLPPCLE